MPFARCIAAGVAPLGQRVRGVFRLPPLSLWTPLSPQRERGCSPLSDPKGVGSNRKYGRFTPFGVKIFSPYFRLPPIGKAPQSLRDSSPQGSGFRKSTYSRCAWTAGQQQQMQLPGTAPPGEMQLQRQMQFTRTTPPVKMRLERSAERATATTAACGGNREELLGQRPAGCKARSRAAADAGSRNPSKRE